MSRENRCAGALFCYDQMDYALTDVPTTRPNSTHGAGG
jgi:hypothetical protein